MWSIKKTLQLTDRLLNILTLLRQPNVAQQSYNVWRRFKTHLLFSFDSLFGTEDEDTRDIYIGVYWFTAGYEIVYRAFF